MKTKYQVFFKSSDQLDKPWLNMGCFFSEEDAQILVWSLADQGMAVKVEPVS